jgi:hypothetical protein
VHDSVPPLHDGCARVPAALADDEPGPVQPEEDHMDQAQPIPGDPLRNRGTAFTDAERRELGLVGRPPAAVEALDQQAARAYAPDDAR